MTPANLRVTLIQTALDWHDPAANRLRFDRLTATLHGQTDLVVLPEMFSTGFTMAAEQVAEPVDGPTTQWMRATAARLNAVVTGSLVTRDGDDYFNRLIWMRPDGRYDTYDKRHLFRMASEQNHYAPGISRLIVDLNGWKVSPLICYDLRFPVWSRNRIGTAEGYDVLIFVANWPERRRYPWQTLLRARAIENMSYCIGVNRVGSDAAGVEHTGDSAALDFLGQPLCPDLEGEAEQTVSLDYAKLLSFREKFGAHKDADDFSLT
ncbi:amidohydrolase [Povalibacter sp.]|uniref:amidohydrolase n=1 Tax=Povalibacter sp. TaxID=1962978 RepID=UPI002F3EA44E